MALSELAAFEAAYQVLQPLDAAARRRALAWLSDSLGAGVRLSESSTVERLSSTPAATPAIAAPRRGGRAVKADAPAPRAARGRGRGEAHAETRTPARSETRTGTRAGARRAPAETSERQYRRMPPIDDVLAAYRQVGTVKGLADHFGVPPHTVQGWARRLRSLGHPIGRER